MHLKNIDQQIGNNFIRQRNVNNLKNGPGSSADTTGNQDLSNTRNCSSKNTTIDKTSVNMEHTDSPGFSICDNFRLSFKKAYTIAGNVPGYVFSNRKYKNSDFNTKNKYEIAPAKIEESIYKFSRNSTLVEEKDESIHSNEKINKISCESLLIVAEDLLIFLLMIVIFACDLVNLINDSGVLQVEKNTNNEWFVTLLDFYKQIVLFLIFTNVLSIHLAYKRPKLSRFLVLVGFIFNLLIHFHFFDFKTEEQYITEVFISFFLTSYLAIARVYNVFQLIRFM